MTNKELKTWLRQNSSGIYRPANEAADRIDRLERELNDLCITAGMVADWLERSHQINPADMVSRNMDLAKELRMAAMPNVES